MNMSPPMTIATRARDRASGPVNVVARLLAARSHGDCANAIAGARSHAIRLAPILHASGTDRPNMRTSRHLLVSALPYEHLYAETDHSRDAYPVAPAGRSARRAPEPA